MSDDTVRIEVDGEPVEARKGQMIIEVTDRIGQYVPRFCYHEKLSVAANCRMCLVEVEKAPKPLPACATPVGEGMKIFTRSRYAQDAQKATMEFLLINHPLDCPICDQGGECELQDQAMGFGRGVSRYAERKRVVKDKDIGPLVSTDMTRCIHCTRCVRFGQEIAGAPELGTIGRGENMKISTYVEESIDHELSANIIDLCPVGALNNKPYRYSARAWEMLQRPAVGAHDCVGSNLNVHSLRGTVKRVVPRENEAINETWIADRDRFSYEGIYSDDRLETPRVVSGGKSTPTDWQSAFGTLVERLKAADPGRIGMLVSPSATLEEGHLLRRLADHLGTTNIDHRLRRSDFRDTAADPVAPVLGCSIEALEDSRAILVVGSSLRQEAPILAHRVRKAALAGAKVSFVEDQVDGYRFPVAERANADGLVRELAAIVAALDTVPEHLRELCSDVSADDAHRRIIDSLKNEEGARVLLGAYAARHPEFSVIRALAGAIASAAGATLGYVSDGANAVGLHLAGVLPEREAAGADRASKGLDVAGMLDQELDVLLIFGAEPGDDMPDIDAGRHAFVAGFLPFRSRSLEAVSDLMLPIGTFAETSGTFVNCEGRWQSFGGVAHPIGEARPGWKVLRVLGNLLEADGFDYETSEDVLAECRTTIGDVDVDTAVTEAALSAGKDALESRADLKSLPMYEVDPVVRRARALQLTPEALRGRGEAA